MVKEIKYNRIANNIKDFILLCDVLHCDDIIWIEHKHVDVCAYKRIGSSVLVLKENLLSEINTYDENIDNIIEDVVKEILPTLSSDINKKLKVKFI